AVENETTSEAEFTQLLERMAHLRAQEQNAWQADQRAIAAVLTPRQRAIFSPRWIEFQERRRAVMRQRRGRGGPPQRQGTHSPAPGRELARCIGVRDL